MWFGDCVEENATKRHPSVYPDVSETRLVHVFSIEAIEHTALLKITD